MKKKKHIYILFTILIGLFSYTALAQSTKKLIREGNNQYEDGNFSDAEVQYRKSLTDDPNYYKGKFNLGDAMYSQENYEESGKIFNELTERALEPEQKSDIYYNLGNTFLAGQKYQEAIEAYKRSLRLNPDDYDAKYNLEYARKKLSDQQQQQNQDQNQDKDQQDQDKQDQENKDQNKDDQQKDQEQKEQDEKDQQDKQNQDKNDQSEQKQQQQQPQQISKEDAQKMLDALKNDEKKTLQELQKQKAKTVKGNKSEIDW